MHVPGRLSVALSNQTYDFSTAYPHGGTALGLVRDVQVRRTEGRETIIAEEFGQEIVDEIYMSEMWLMGFALRGLDEDALGVVFPNTTTGSVTKNKKIVYPGATIVPGTLRASTALGVLFTSNDTTNHPCVYFPNAIPEATDTVTIDLARAAELIITCVFRALRASNTAGDLCQIARIEDLTL